MRFAGVVLRVVTISHPCFRAVLINDRKVAHPVFGNQLLDVEVGRRRAELLAIRDVAATPPPRPTTQAALDPHGSVAVGVHSSERGARERQKISEDFFFVFKQRRALP